MHAKEQADEEYAKRKIAGKAANKVRLQTHIMTDQSMILDKAKTVVSDPESVDSMVMDVDAEGSDFDDPAPTKRAPTKKATMATKAKAKAPARGKGKKVAVNR